MKRFMAQVLVLLPGTATTQEEADATLSAIFSDNLEVGGVILDWAVEERNGVQGAHPVEVEAAEDDDAYRLLPSYERDALAGLTGAAPDFSVQMVGGLAIFTPRSGAALAYLEDQEADTVMGGLLIAEHPFIADTARRMRTEGLELPAPF